VEFIMPENLNTVLFFIIAIVVFVGILLIGTFRARKAMSKIIAVFYHHDALDVNGAMTLRELGLERPDFVQRMMKLRDYRQYALQILIKQGVINATEDGRLYMVESNLDQRLRSKRDAN
jgi:hypothetical protein